MNPPLIYNNYFASYFGYFSEPSKSTLFTSCKKLLLHYYLFLLFTQRTVQNNKKYCCPNGDACEMDKLNRKRCPACRFNKCMAVGMKVEGKLV